MTDLRSFKVNYLLEFPDKISREQMLALKLALTLGNTGFDTGGQDCIGRTKTFEDTELEVLLHEISCKPKVVQL